MAGEAAPPRDMITIEKHTFGMGDRFGRQGEAQLRAVVEANAAGIPLTPVWNKSHREHLLVGSHPDELRAEAAAAVEALGWRGAWHVDADHIGLATVDPFVAGSDFFTIDVADCIGREDGPAELECQVGRLSRLVGAAAVDGIDRPLEITAAMVRQAAAKFGWAAREAGRIHRHIAGRKGEGAFIAEVSVDETDTPQTPAELLLILALLADEGVPVQTIAPKFTGRFNKGVDYAGDLAAFEREFDADLCVLAHAVREFGLPQSLKLSVHSGSDKFSLYPVIRRLIAGRGAGLHVKTAGTTWLEELIGLAESGGEGLAVAKRVYQEAHARFAELAAPYATVIDVDRARLPAPEAVARWGAADYAGALRHVPGGPRYNPHLRQLLHVAFKVAAELGERFTAALEANAARIARNVTANLLERHIRPIFG